jgi:dipeptidyl aminopeptidase/acylaminoacyl peptidase
MHPVTLEDLFRFRLVGDPQIAPDGKRVVFTVRRTDRAKNKYFTALWMADPVSETARPFTGDGHSDGNPRWSPDGAKIAFISDRDKPGSQIYLIPADGGEAEKLTSLREGGVQAIEWSPDGSRIAFLFRATPADHTDKAQKERKEKELSSPVRVHRKLFYRLDGFGYYDDSFWQVWVVDVASREARALTDEPFNHGAPAWTPDGEALIFVANRRDDNDLKGMYDDLWRIPASGGEPQRIAAPDGPKDCPVVSPDGTHIAYVGHTDPDDTWGGRNERVLLIPVEGSDEVLDLTGASDMAVGYLTLSDMHDAGGGRLLQWSPDGKQLYFPISAHGDTRLCTVPVEGGEIVPLTPADMEMGGFSITTDGSTIAVTLGSATDPHEVAILSPGDATVKPRTISEVNCEVLSEVDLQMPDAVELPNGDGGMVHTWVLKPADCEEGRKYPCVLYVHGGPSLQYGGRAAPFHELQWLAASGYVVVFSNPRGSKGYGEDHTRAIHGDWGNKDFADIMTVADYAASLPCVDAERMAIMGGSYGGFMTAWAIGHTDRFRCAIADRLVGNMHSMSGTCDFPWEHGKEFGGNAWDDPSELWRCSPLKYAGNITTPLLLIHSDGDLRCPIEQAEQLFAALRWQRKTVEFARYPAETSHGLSRNGPPDLREDRLKRNLAWLERWLKGNDA